MRHGRSPPLLLSLLALALPASAAFQSSASDARPQILWQRSLDDALALSREQDRPILIAVNMDGETASEQIVRDRYREAAFVTSTGRCVCLVASVFRHTPRDYDDDGRRIPCPRLGEVTCGEHIALEPILYDKYLGTKRIAPRHALIQVDGTRTFDLYELFDLRELDQQLAEASARAPAAADDSATRDLDTLSQAKDNRSRTDFEARVAAEHGQDSWRRSLELVRSSADPGSIGALRILFVRLLHEVSLDVAATRAAELRSAADQIGSRAELNAVAIERLTALGPYPGSAHVGRDALALHVVEQHPPGPARTALTACVILHLDELFGMRSNGAWTDGQGKPSVLTSTNATLSFARWVRESGQRSVRQKDPLPGVEALERRLAELEAELGTAPNDSRVQEAFGRTSLALAQRKAETRERETQYFLEDASKWLTQASEARPKDAGLLLERARAAYYLSKFDEQEQLAERALCTMPELSKLDDPSRLAAEIVRPPERIEALRWLGDATARLLPTRAQADSNVEADGIARGAWALGAAAASPQGDETDWQSYASFLGALGLKRDEYAALQEGATRFPESDVLRQALNAALWNAGRVDLIPIKAEWLFDRNPGSGACAWHAGYAHVLQAEDARRREEPSEAIAAYRRAEERFRHALELAPQFKDTTEHYLAMCALGRGFSLILAGQRDEASQCLPEAIAIRPAVAGVRDGLEREAVDLLDYSLELRRGEHSPVDPLALLSTLEQADPKNGTWARWVADSELREALRAEGRNERAETNRYLDLSIRAGERAVAIDDSVESRKTLAQSLAIAADIALDEHDLAQAGRRLAQAAALLEEAVPAADADEAALKQLAGQLREKLGAARPRFRPGR